MNYRILMNFSILLFVILTLQCSNATSPNEIFNKGDIIGTWVKSYTVEELKFKFDSLTQLYIPYYDTGIGYKTCSITYDTIKISSGSIHPCPCPCCCTPLVGTWSYGNDSIIIYPISDCHAFSTRYLITKHLPDSLIFSSSDGIDTCVKQ
jgi:hypothetical protein